MADSKFVEKWEQTEAKGKSAYAIKIALIITVILGGFFYLNYGGMNIAGAIYMLLVTFLVGKLLFSTNQTKYSIKKQKMN